MMDPFDKDRDKDKDKSKRDPYDPFGFDDIFDNFLNDDDIRNDIRKMTEEMMKMFNNMEPGKPFVHGFKVNFGPDGKPKIEDFGNRRVKSSKDDSTISEEHEPITDIMEGDEDVSVTLETPGVEKEDIDLNVTRGKVKIDVHNPKRKYNKEVDLPCDVKPKTTKATYKNGILDIVIKRKNKKSSDKGYNVDIK